MCYRSGASVVSQDAIIKLVYSDATRDACERADYNVPMAFTRNSRSTSLYGSLSWPRAIQVRL